MTQGEASVKSLARVERDGKVLHEGKVVSLKHFKEEVKAVRTGKECGVVIGNFSNLAQGDRITFYDIVSRKPGLYDDDVG